MKFIVVLAKVDLVVGRKISFDRFLCLFCAYEIMDTI